MGGGYWSFEHIPSLVESGKLDEAVLDIAVSRVLRAKFVMGLFEQPFTAVPDDEILDHLNTDEYKSIARQLDTESIVLLENHGSTLPLKRDANVAVIGPMAHGYVNVSYLTYILPLFPPRNPAYRTLVWRLCYSHLHEPWCYAA